MRSSTIAAWSAALLVGGLAAATPASATTVAVSGATITVLGSADDDILALSNANFSGTEVRIHASDAIALLDAPSPCTVDDSDQVHCPGSVVTLDGGVGEDRLSSSLT